MRSLLTVQANPGQARTVQMSRNLQSVDKFAKGSPFTIGQIRWWIFNSQHNGLDAAGAVVRIGRRVYLDQDGLDRWIATQNERGAAPKAAA